MPDLVLEMLDSHYLVALTQVQEQVMNHETNPESHLPLRELCVARVWSLVEEHTLMQNEK